MTERLLADVPRPTVTHTAEEGAQAAPPVTVAIVGAGSRGQVYAQFCAQNPGLARVVAIAEPRPRARAYLASQHPHAQTFPSFDQLLDASASTATAPSTGGKPRLADAVVVAVHDHMHAEAVKRFVAAGWHCLCEKPMATSQQDCRDMTEAVEAAGVIFGIGHVLRYSPYNAQLVKILRTKQLGEVINIVHIEPVGHWHFAHSYVRGNWSREHASSFGLMTKCCHDLDILLHYMQPHQLVRVSSFGSLKHFKPSNKPTAAAGVTRCFDCPSAVEQTCPYSAKRIYLDPARKGVTSWPIDILTDGPPTVETVTAALEDGPYGKCVYEGHNDIVDHQVVNLEFDNGATASLTMVAFTSLICERLTRIHCSHGEIVGDSTSITVTDFTGPNVQRLTPQSEVPSDAGTGHHGGGDMGLMRSFITAVRKQDQSVLGVTVREALRSHEAVFAAEKSRKEGRVVSLEDGVMRG